MKSSRGFFLVYELLCFGLTAVLLACAAQGFTACLVAQGRSLELQEAWQQAQLAAAGVEGDISYYTQLDVTEQNGYQFVEVRVYAAENGRQLCSLVEAQP